MIDVERTLERLGIEHRRKGRRAWALCPFHVDSDPSWSINLTEPRLGLHHCFSCKKGGDIYALAMHVLGVSFPGAKSWVDGEPGVDAPLPPMRVKFNPLRPVLAPFELPREMIVEPLADWVSAARRYIVSRGITAAQVARWGIGYAVNGRLSGRVIIPIRDGEGRPLNYTARTFAGDAKRYLMADTAERPSPAAVFGEQYWPAPDAKGRRGAVLVFEGAINALAVERVAPNVALGGLDGSNIDALGQAAKLCTFRRVGVLVDQDKAGDHAWNALRMMLGRHAKVERVTMPAGPDPAEMEPEQLRYYVQAWHAASSPVPLSSVP